MTIELSTAAIGGTLAAGLVTATGFVVRVMVLDRIRALESSVKGQGERFGEDVKNIVGWQKAHDAVENYIAKRTRTSPVGIPTQEE